MTKTSFIVIDDVTLSLLNLKRRSLRPTRCCPLARPTRLSVCPCRRRGVEPSGCRQRRREVVSSCKSRRRSPYQREFQAVRDCRSPRLHHARLSHAVNPLLASPSFLTSGGGISFRKSQRGRVYAKEPTTRDGFHSKSINATDFRAVYLFVECCRDFGFAILLKVETDSRI